MTLVRLCVSCTDDFSLVWLKTRFLFRSTFLSYAKPFFSYFALFVSLSLCLPINFTLNRANPVFPLLLFIALSFFRRDTLKGGILLVLIDSRYFSRFFSGFAQRRLPGALWRLPCLFFEWKVYRFNLSARDPKLEGEMHSVLDSLSFHLPLTFLFWRSSNLRKSSLVTPVAMETILLFRFPHIRSCRPLIS